MGPAAASSRPPNPPPTGRPTGSAGPPCPLPPSPPCPARQLNDPFVARAKREGYRSRAAYKLIALDDRLHLLAPGKTVVDLGAAPRGWTQGAAARVRAPGEGRVAAGASRGVDIVPVVAPSISEARLRKVVSLEPSYIYAALRVGITGAYTEIGEENHRFLERLRPSGAKSR